MALNFPDSPANGDTTTLNGVTYTYNSTSNKWKASTSSGGSSGGGGGSSTTVYTNVADLPLTGNTTGAQAYVSATNRLYIWNGTGWFNIALINTSPTITSGGAGSYTLATDGTATVVTLVATDPEEVPITWTYTVTSGSLTNGGGATATVSQADNVFTITPTTNTAYAGEFTLTFTASDGINIATDVNSFTLAFNSPYWKHVDVSVGTSASTGDNKQFTDKSTNAYAVTTSGEPMQSSFNPYLDNWSIHFDTNTDRIYTDVSGSADFAIGTNDFSYEAFVYIDSDFTLPSYSRCMGLGTYYNSATSFGVMLSDVDNASAVGVYWGEDGANASRQLTTNVAAPKGRWFHIATCRVGSDIALFVDGTRVAQGIGSSTGSIGNGANTYAYVGHTGSTTEGFEGYISNVRFINGSSAYNPLQTTITVPTEKLTATADTKLLTCQSNRFIDESTSGHTFTVSTGTRVLSDNPFGNNQVAIGGNYGSVDLAGSDYLETAGNQSLGNFGTGDYTVEFWIYKRGTSNDCIIDLRGGDLNYGVSVEMDTQVTVFYGGSPFQDTGSFNNFAWNHIAICRSSGLLKGFINGSEIFSVADSNNRSTSADRTARIGVNYGGAQPTDAIISDVRVTHTAVYTAAFTPPTSPVGTTDAQLYMPMDGANIYDKAGNAVVTTMGGLTTSSSVTKYAGRSLEFNGTDAKAEIEIAGDPISYEWGTGDWTVETWVKDNLTTDAVRAIFNIRSAAYGLMLRRHTANRWELYYFGSSRVYQTITDYGGLTDWYHIAVSRENGTIRWFVDGVEVWSIVSAGATNYTIATLGEYAGAWWDGYIEGFQITNGYAKYTANFTPPTTEQGQSIQAHT